MKLLFVGKTDFQYNRDLVLMNGLKARDDVELLTHRIKKRNWKTFQHIKKLSSQVDFVVIPSFGHKDVTFVKLASKAPVVFDPLISKYMTKVLDYKVTWKAPHKYAVDWLSFHLPDILIWDTLAHQKYLRKKYRLRKPMTTIYIGADTNLFFPISKPDKQKNKTIVGFYGSFNPLQGIDKIVRTAHLLKENDEIEFHIIGSGSTYKSVRKLADKLKLNNIKFTPTIPYEKLNAAINSFDICLGVFGESLKTDVVIPNKIYHYSAAKKCTITKDTQAIKELFSQEENIYLVKNDPEEIKNAILHLCQHQKTSENIAQKAYTLITEQYNQNKIADDFVKFLRSCS